MAAMRALLGMLFEGEVRGQGNFTFLHRVEYWMLTSLQKSGGIIEGGKGLWLASQNCSGRDS
eukprot:364953-Chlamydomonas_euryale.AAC.12